MSDYIFELWNILNSARQGVLNVIEGSMVEALAGEFTMSILVNPYLEDGTQQVGLLGESAALILHAQKYIRVQAPNGNAYYFIIRNCKKELSEDGSVTIRVECEHHKYQLINRIVQVDDTYTQINATQALSVIMSGVTGFSVTTNQIPTTIYRDVTLEYPTVMAALKYLCDIYTEFDGSVEHRFYYLVDNTGSISILRDDATGTIAGYPLITFHNLHGLTDERQDATLANRIYHSGIDNTIGFADAVSIKDSSLSSGAVTYFAGFVAVSETFTLNDGGLSTNPVAWDSIVTMRLNSIYFGSWSSGSGSFIVTVRIELLNSADTVVVSRTEDLGEVTYPNRSVGNPKWFSFKLNRENDIRKIRYTTTAVTLNGGANPNGIGTQKTALEYELAPNIDYVQDAASQATYGVVEARIENRDYPPVKNIIRSWKNQGSPLQVFDSTLSGTYTAGLCNVFAETSAAFVTTQENTNPLYIKNGTRSQRVVVGFPGHGVKLSTAFPRMVEGWTYQAYFAIYVVSGTITIKIYKDYPASGTELFSHVTAGSQWLEVLTETGFGLPSGSGAAEFDVQITGSSGAEFYVDSFCIARSPDPIEFYKDISANLLKDKAQRILRLNALPRTRYQVTASDLGTLDNAYNMATLNVGDDIYVRDTIGGVNTLVKIYRKDTDLFNPTRTQLTLADRITGAAELIAVLSGERNLGGT